MATKEEIRPIYAELQGYLSQAPDGSKEHMIRPDVWRLYHQTIDELNRLTGADYSRFKVTPESASDKHGTFVWVELIQYRTRLGGLINRLHAEFFGDEQPPFSGSPSMIISQTQQQSQIVHMQIILELRDQLTRSEMNYEEGSKESGFISKVKDYLASALSGTTSMAQLILLLLNVAKECGLSVDDLRGIFGG